MLGMAASPAIGKGDDKPSQLYGDATGNMIAKTTVDTQRCGVVNHLQMVDMQSRPD
jgi:hypothetical protein